MRTKSEALVHPERPDRPTPNTKRPRKAKALLASEGHWLVNIEALAELLRDDTAAAPSELIEMVDAVIGYFEALDEADGCTTDGLGELIAARVTYHGPGIRGGLT